MYSRSGIIVVAATSASRARARARSRFPRSFDGEVQFRLLTFHSGKWPSRAVAPVFFLAKHTRRKKVHRFPFSLDPVTVFSFPFASSWTGTCELRRTTQLSIYAAFRRYRRFCIILYSTVDSFRCVSSLSGRLFADGSGVARSVQRNEGNRKE